MYNARGIFYIEGKRKGNIKWAPYHSPEKAHKEKTISRLFSY